MSTDSKKASDQISKQTQQLINNFCTQEKLPDTYKLIAEKYFIPLAYEILESEKNQTSNKPFMIGINGSQGSGKSTLALFINTILTKIFNKRVANLSIDDFYQTKSERQQMATNIHPLLQTRGVPGTHDINLLNTTLSELSSDEGKAFIPRFDKSTDDRHPESEWDEIQAPVDIIILEGWCVGVRSQSAEQLSKPINALEQQEDKQGIWRNYINQLISKDYSPLFKRLDTLIMLKAPSFDCVYQWRQKQEDKLRDKMQGSNKKIPDDQSGIMNHLQLQRFIQHYERLTINMLETLPNHADIVFNLSADHRITNRLNHTPDTP